MIDNIKTMSQLTETSHLSEYETYILDRNISLQSQYEELLIKNTDSENKIRASEQNLEHTEGRLNHIKELFKNFHKIRKWDEEIAKCQYNIIKTTRSFVTVYKSSAAWHLRILHCIFMIVLGISWELIDIYTFSSIATLLGITVSFQWSMLQNLKLPLCQDLMRKVQDVKDKKERYLDDQDYLWVII